MLQAHSLLWHYLWIAPNVFLLVLGFLGLQRGLGKKYPAFLAFALIAGAEQLVLYAADVLPWVTAQTFWNVLWAGLLVEALLKIILIGELFAHIFDPYPAVAKLGRTLIRGIGAALLLFSALAAAYAPGPNIHFIVSGPHLLEQTIYLIESGLLLFIFIFAAYFRLSSNRTALGICLGLAISACVHLGTWAFAAHNIPAETSALLDMLNMATYHVCVLIWFYYLLVPQKSRTKSPLPLPDGNLDVWNRELERLLQQ